MKGHDEILNGHGKKKNQCVFPLFSSSAILTLLVLASFVKPVWSQSLTHNSICEC